MGGWGPSFRGRSDAACSGRGNNNNGVLVNGPYGWSSPGFGTRGRSGQTVWRGGSHRQRPVGMEIGPMIENRSGTVRYRSWMDRPIPAMHAHRQAVGPRLQKAWPSG